MDPTVRVGGGAGNRYPTYQGLWDWARIPVLVRIQGRGTKGSTISLEKGFQKPKWGRGWGCQSLAFSSRSIVLPHLSSDALEVRTLSQSISSVIWLTLCQVPGKNVSHCACGAVCPHCESDPQGHCPFLPTPSPLSTSGHTPGSAVIPQLVQGSNLQFPAFITSHTGSTVFAQNISYQIQKLV